MISVSSAARPIASSANLINAESPPDSCATLSSSQTSDEDGNDIHQLGYNDDEDEEATQLKRLGDLRQVVGSQSMLSQELMRPSQVDDDSEDEDVVEDARSSLLDSRQGHWPKSAFDNLSQFFTQPEQGSCTDKDVESTNKDDIASVLLSLPNTQLEDVQDDGMMMGLDAIKHAANNHLSKNKLIKTEQVRQEKEEDVQEIADTHDDIKPLSQTSFGSLLDAIQIVHEQDHQAGNEESGPKRRIGDTAPTNERPKRRRVAPNKHLESVTHVTKSFKASNKKSKGNNVDRKVEPPMSTKKRSTPAKLGSTSYTSTSTPKSRIEVAKYVYSQGSPQQASPAFSKTPLASPSSSTSTVHVLDAAELATKIIHDSELAKELLLSMALCRTNPRTPPESIPGPGHVLEDGFFWSRYPPLEAVLKDNMPEYYRLSIEKCQSCQQQCFNNRLVDEVTATATEQGWEFDPEHFNDVKILRDRIRCYYKTHIQNAKKRLKTMLRNPTKKSNAIHLREHYDLIQQAAQKKRDADENDAAWD
ncbi:hypothetical protein FisN_19Hh171 [Fistulifera solaris]|jgi:hypothetical protein|uniref:Uncharacterized protein n=1 Tax=Fistulifera solaris TaxID=1519565 RepID=A0A1Z5K0E4_FISSO|nr:hypothetical protein FisN_19Hh171 [Fistulifera solaris]|eukprot:GAX19592.1 hypothetical protein FisN_19Hh171 [Fistulifera solaris]